MKFCVTILFVLLIASLPAQTTTFVIQPDAACGKDAYLYAIAPNNNLGNFPDFIACSWTHSGAPSTVRSIIEFDLNGLPPGTVILQATLDLFHYSSTQNAGHSTLSGSNAAHLYRVTQSWNEHTVTWNSQPSYTTVNSVALPASTSNSQNYSVDVKNLVQDCVNNPSNSFGFMFKGDIESYYRSMLFASSDNGNQLLNPRLTIVIDGNAALTNNCGVTTTVEPPDTTIVNPPDTTVTNPPDTTITNPPGTIGTMEDVIIPNLFSPNGDEMNDMYFITCPVTIWYRMYIYNRWGQKVAEVDPEHPSWNGKLNGTSCPDGVYYYIIELRPPNLADEKRCGFIQLINERP